MPTIRFLTTLSLSAVAVIGSAYAQDSSADKTDTMDKPEDSSQGLSIRPSVSVGFDFSQGDFGADLDTTTLSVPVSLRADVGDFRVFVAGSWLQIEGPGGVVGDGVIVGDGPTGVLETNSGFGDLTLGVNYNVPTDVTGKWLVQLQGRLKLPTASVDDGLGTGELDGGGNIDIAYDFGRFTPFTTLGYRFRGDPEGVELNNTFNASVGAAYNLGGGYALLGSYDFRQRTTDTAENSNEIFGAVSGRFNSNVRWTLYGSVGLTAGAPDGGAGVQLIIRP